MMTLTLSRRIEDSSGVTLEFTNADGTVSVLLRVNNPEVDTSQYKRNERYQFTITAAS